MLTDTKECETFHMSAREKKWIANSGTIKKSVFVVLISPLLGVFLGTLLYQCLWILKTDFSTWSADVPDMFVSAAGTAIAGLVFSIPIVVLYGLPIAYLLGKYKLQNFWMYGLFGFIGGTAFIMMLVTGEPGRDDPGLIDNLLSAVQSFYGVNGLMTALVFWFFTQYIPSREKSHQGDREGIGPVRTGGHPDAPPLG